jgi:hypothetical protein
MKRKLTIFSICLNFALLGVFLFLRNSHSEPRPENSQSPQSKIIRQTNFVTTGLKQTSERIQFQWRSIESADYPTYIANLRAIGCPEKTILNIILADVEKLYEEREKQLEMSGKFWVTGDENQKLFLARAEKLFAMKEEKRALLRTLLNTELDAEVLRDWYRGDDLGMFMAFLPDSEAERVLSMVKKYADRFQRIEKRTGRLTIPEDAEEKQKIYAEMMAALGQIMSPWEVEEGDLRLVSVLNRAFSMGAFKDSGLTGAELRYLTKLQNQSLNLLQAQLAKFDGQDSAPELAAKQAYFRQARQFLGDARFQKYLSAEDRDFRQFQNLVQESGIATQTALGIYDIQQMALLESTRIREDRTLGRKEQEAELQTCEGSTRDAVNRLLGETIAARYATNGGYWIDEIGKR